MGSKYCYQLIAPSPKSHLFGMGKLYLPVYFWMDTTELVSAGLMAGDKGCILKTFLLINEVCAGLVKGHRVI